jgi:hypothetical protein
VEESDLRRNEYSSVSSAKRSSWIRIEYSLIGFINRVVAGDFPCGLSPKAMKFQGSEGKLDLEVSFVFLAKFISVYYVPISVLDPGAIRMVDI